MNYAVFSIPGLPASFAKLNSRYYHNPYPFIHVMEELWGPTEEVDAFLWPLEVPHPWGQFSLKLPFSGMAFYYPQYLNNTTYRERIVEEGKRRLERLLQKYDQVVVIAHSHGNRIFIDVMQSLEVPEGKELIWLSQAPAYSGVFYGCVPTTVKGPELKAVVSNLDHCLIFRIESDCLSGKPLSCLEHFHFFKPRWWERVFLAHSKVREREDILKRLKEELRKI